MRGSEALVRVCSRCDGRGRGTCASQSHALSWPFGSGDALCRRLLSRELQLRRQQLSLHATQVYDADKECVKTGSEAEERRC